MAIQLFYSAQLTTEAFEQLFFEYQPRLVRFAVHYLAANTANLLPGYFSSVGLFSPVVHKEQLPKDSAMYYIYTGQRDMFHGNAKRFDRRMDKAQAPHEYTETIGGHTWRNWRLYLSDYMVKIHQ